jgi:soluble lytic murein transglycosylase
LLAALVLTLALLYGGLVVLRVLYPINYLPLILAAAQEEKVDPALLCALIRAESRFHPSAVSPRGAIGLMQIIPETAASIATSLGVDDYVPADLAIPEVNVRFGSWYLRQMLDRFENTEVALMAYNAGPTRVTAWLEQSADPFPETLAYVSRVAQAVSVYRIYLHCPMLVQITPLLPF